MTERPLLVCLLPVRNGHDDLPGYLECVRSFVDAVVALDDGSTDDTRALLERDPLVAEVLDNPPRSSYLGWDDGANRARLLEAAGRLQPRWILSLDVDERMSTEEGAALRRFVAEEAIPGLAYGFCEHRTWDDGQVESTGWWVYRLFSWTPGLTLPEQQLHFEPIPVGIGPQRRAKLSLRIRHLAGATPERRSERVRKYAEVDPDRRWGFAYQDLAEDVTTAEWEPWLPGTPVLQPHASAIDEDHEEPALSAIVISRDDGPRILRAVRSVVEQQTDDRVEVIVVTSGTGNAAELVRSQFPDVVVVELPEPALPGAARNAGLRVARGEYVSFPGSHVELPTGSLAARIRAHDAGYCMVTGTTLNGTDTPAGWASYFLDHSDVLPGRPSQDLAGPPAHCSYVRRALLKVGGFPPDLRAGEDTVVNQRLAAMGHRARRAQEVHLVHHTPCDTPARLLRHYAQRGRAYGRILLAEHRETGFLLRRRGLLRQFDVQVRRRVGAVDEALARWGDAEEVRQYRSVRTLVILTATAHWLGTCAELLRPEPGKPFVLAGRPVITVRDPAGAATRVDLVTRRVQVVSTHPSATITPALRVDGTGSWPSTRHPARLLQMLCGRATSGLDISERLSLAWARATVPVERVHYVQAGRLGDADNGDDQPDLERLLDTRAPSERRELDLGPRASP